VPESRAPLSRFLVRFDPPPQFIQRVSEQFPEIEFVVAPDSTFHDILPIADAVMAWRLSESELATASQLKWVQWIGAGVENAPLAAMKQRGIVLTNNRGVHATNIAEHVIALMLAFARALPFLLQAQSRAEWADESGRKRVMEIQGTNLLSVGAGNIGRALATRAIALGQNVSLVGRTGRVRYEDAPTVHPLSSLADLLPDADHVAICLPLTPETFGLFDEPMIRNMKVGSFLYNIGRGPIVDTGALTQALINGHLGGAGLDVVDPEPLPPGHPLWAMHNVILTAHTAGATPQYWNRACDVLCENIERYRSGFELRNLVDFDLGY
jgi:phosphoglycerate dehydrogenase-like enzyme